mmetsp:Transcript_112342/g.322974  ORF Transcript_112342/g.322974 Transcript_112342/m.322974 type:complete len:505 (-) Transcript_112342:327-1841(-)
MAVILPPPKHRRAVPGTPPPKRRRVDMNAAARLRCAEAAGTSAALAARAATGDASETGEALVARLQRASLGLRPDGWKGKLPCREAEQEKIGCHLRKAVKAGGSTQVLYISGMPGAGKTASLMHTVKMLASDKALPRIIIVHINAMRLGSPAAVFAEIYGQIRSQLSAPQGAGSSCAACAAHMELASFFEARKPSDPVVLLLIDEIDHLVTRNQAVLYRVFAWLSLPQPRLVVAAISNTMDLPERLLPRVASRFGIVRVEYAPYRRDQIVQILHERLEGHGALGSFTPMTLKLCAARVAAASGDIRKALQLCRRAIEVRLAERASPSSDSPCGSGGPVNVKHLEVAEHELVRDSPAVVAIGGLSRRARRILAALLLELHHREAEVVPLSAVAARYTRLMEAAAAAGGDSAAIAEEKCPASLRASALPGIAGHDDDEVCFLVLRLEAMAIVALQSHRMAEEPDACTLALGSGLDTDDLAAALESSDEHAGILELVRESRPRRKAV